VPPSENSLNEAMGHYAVQGHWRSLILVPIESSYASDFPLVTNTNLPHILHRFRNITFNGSKIAIFGYPVVFNFPDGGVPWDLGKILRGCEWMTNVPNAVEILPKIIIGWVGCMSVTDRQQTDGRQHIANTNASSRSLTKKLQPGLVAYYDIWPGNGEGLFWFRRFINLSLTYLLRHLFTCAAADPHRANMPAALECQPI